jgi:hypothetical protein
LVVAGDTREGRDGVKTAPFDPVELGSDAVRLVLNYTSRRETMLFTIAVILLVLWLLGLVSGYTLGNFIYVLLVIALVLFVLGLVSGRSRV